MVNKIKFKGLIAATFTPFKDNGEVNTSAIPAMVEQLIMNRISGVYICGSTGEGHSLSLKDRKLVAEEIIRAAAGRLTAIINVGHNCLDDARELARHAAAIGADAISATPPVYYKINSTTQLVKIFEKVTSAAPDLPFYYYHIPALTGFHINMPEFLHEGTDRLPSLCGIKFTAPDIHEFQSCLDVSDGRYQIMYGKDEMLLSGLVAGADCLVGSTYNFMAPIYHEIISHFKAGELKQAAEAQLRANKIIEIFLRYDSLPAQKAIMSMVGMDCGPVRLPLVDLAPEDAMELRDELLKTDLFNWAGLAADEVKLKQWIL